MSSFKRCILVLLLGLLAIFVQSTLLKAILPQMVIPNFLLILLVFLAFYETSLAGVITAFLLGLEFDLHGGILLGPWAGSFVAVYCALASLSQRIFVDSALAAFTVVLFSSFLSSFIFVVLVFEFQPVQLGLMYTAFIEALLNGFLAPPLMALLRKYMTRRER